MKGIEINHELERLISGHERDGQLTFNQFHKALKLHLMGQTQYEFEKHAIHTDQNDSKLNVLRAWEVASPEKPLVSPQLTKTYQSSVKLDDFSPASPVLKFIFNLIQRNLRELFEK